MSKDQKSDLETFYPEGLEVKIRGEQIKIKPFVLKTRVKVIKFISELMSEMVAQNPNLAQVDKIQVGFALLRTAGERMIEVYRIVLDKPDEWLEGLTLKDEMVILKAMSEVNDFPFLFREIQNLYEVADKKQQG